MSHPYHSAGCGCAHDSLDQAQLTTLYPSIDLSRIVCYNESQPNQARTIIRPWEDRHNPTPHLDSADDDSELLLLVPFTTNVKVRSLTVRSEGERAPDKVRLFVNREDLDLSSVGDTQPAQEINLAADPEARLDYPLKVQRFQNVSSLLLYFPSNHSGDSETSTRIHWLHLKGEASKDRREIVYVVYEAIARPSDHKTADEQHVARTIQ